ncbi:NAD(P)-dependent oxidoreductase [Histomonas meleagridis]|uniref:NAD(P)-dependent oxidoreductase n=1 Tax=Histomonas meleagridis TaxID=135588 RepID=UPI0035594F05|nr:NAD(P)-dependent oxidoreductase [Histomonas meleagridis]KAH0797488.1 NAD(P)-dependent oxidoreductase [Histomonas meleagridis]
MSAKKVFITGASGVMGHASFIEIYRRRKDLNIVLLLLDDQKTRRLFLPYKNDPRVSIVWGDLRDYKSVLECVEGCDYVLHIGGLVSPTADYYPKKTFEVNVKAAENIVKAVKSQPNSDDIKVIYIGTVAETGDRNDPIHWGRCGDPINISIYDHYAISKVQAERVFSESGLKHWVSLRQSGILHPGLLHNIGPIVFHVVLRGVLEWATIEDSATLMCNVLNDDVPETFWRKFYNIGSGEEYRLTNYDFEEKILHAIGMGHNAPQKLFEPNWFITRNFHGQWFSDSDELDNILHFRHNIPIKEYFKNMKRNLPWFFKYTYLAANAIGKMFMKAIAYDKRFGTLSWLKEKDETRIKAYFGSYEEWQKVPKTWELTNLSPPSKQITYLDHGYDETKPISELSLEDMKKAAHFRGGECLSDEMEKGNLYKPLKWKCAFGHTFEMTPNTVLKGGHWCPKCDPIPWNYDEIEKVNPFFAQVWRPFHNKNESNVFDESIYKDYDEYKLKRSSNDWLPLVIMFFIISFTLMFIILNWN